MVQTRLGVQREKFILKLDTEMVTCGGAVLQ